MSRPPLSFVVLDTETTGLDPARDCVIEIGALRLDEKLRETARFTSLVHAGVSVPLAITRMTGIGDADLRDAPPPAEALTALGAFAGDSLLVAHNAAFDRSHLEAAARRAGLPRLANEWFDTLDAALLLLPEHDRHALPLLSAALGFKATSHRALPDAEATAVLLRLLAARAAGLGAEERHLLETVRWPPLSLLDQIDAAPDEAPPPLVAGEPDAATRGARITILPCDADGWRAEFAATPEDETSGARGAKAAPPEDDVHPPRRGLAARLPGYRPRQGQVTMAGAVAAVLDHGGVGLFEAGTGMGKSLAYLLPSAFAGASTGARVVVSTKTKALQRQLAAHELPLVAESLPAGWRWAVLMGRENYLCRRRLDEAVQTESAALPDEARALALAYLVGRARRGEVDLSALPFRAQRALPALAELARELRSSRATCLGRHCPARRLCHWRLARARAEAAHLVCVNHALLLTGRDALPPFELVVVDEAHLLPSEATSAFSESVDWWTLELLGHTLRGPGRQRPLGGRLKALAKRATPDQARALSAAGDATDRLLDDLPQLGRAIGEALVRIVRSADESHDAGHATADESAGGRRSPTPADYNLTAWLTPGLRESPSWDAFANATGVLGERLTAAAAAAAAAAEVLPEEHRERPALLALAEDAGRAAAMLIELPETRGADVVLWAEIEAASGAAPVGSSGPRWTLTRTPLTPAHDIREALWDRLRGAVLTSATLTVAGSFAYFREMAGLTADVEVREEVFASPFDYARQAVLVLEHDPDSAWRPAELAERQGERLKRLAEVTGGRTLALFTNKRDMHRVASAVGAHVEDDGVLVLAQGMHGSAAAVAEEFRAHPETILLGVDTLWTGQDFPGDTLVCLVIAKLPFPRQDPLVQARRRACLEEGVDWFRRFYLPEAVLKFRQGFGRLIRTETDAGVVVVLDHRLTQKTYRRDFLESLPSVPVVEAAPADVPAMVAAHLRRLMPEDDGQPAPPS